MILNLVTMTAQPLLSLKKEEAVPISRRQIISLSSGAPSELDRLQSLSLPIFTVWRSGLLLTAILFLGLLLTAVTAQPSTPSTKIRPITSSSHLNSLSTDSGLGMRNYLNG